MDNWVHVVGLGLIVVVVALLVWWAGVGWGMRMGRGEVVAAEAQRDLLAERLRAAEDSAADDREVAAQLAPLQQALNRVERQVGTLERDRVEQFGQLGAALSEVAQRTSALGQQTATLAGALNSSGVRGTWGEAQLRRVLEHAGMLARCDFEEQVSAVSRHDARVRPDVVVRLPGDKCLVIDAKSPLDAFLRAQGEGVPPTERTAYLQAHATALRGHVDALAGKAYWSAFATSPELVICFVPSDAVLAAALQAEPDLYDHAQARKVVLASPATLLAVLRATAFAWQQDSVSEHAREVLRLGSELHTRLATLGKHVGEMGSALSRSVETYNRMVGTLESRVMVTSRKMHEIGVVGEAPPALEAVATTPRPLTQSELIDAELQAVGPPRDELSDDVPHAPDDGRRAGRRTG
ncbi:MAG: DNA recombination protein RmuC [Ornithinimicrobium sp.]|uniref:DNA recombination protein RmuC n=1 Tax=Ornithinimicrobium sp. TaxID=1977084 RepID=UPI003D9B6C2C